MNKNLKTEELKAQIDLLVAYLNSPSLQEKEWVRPVSADGDENDWDVVPDEDDKARNELYKKQVKKHDVRMTFCEDCKVALEDIKDGKPVKDGKVIISSNDEYIEFSKKGRDKEISLRIPLNGNQEYFIKESARNKQSNEVESEYVWFSTGINGTFDLVGDEKDLYDVYKASLENKVVKGYKMMSLVIGGKKGKVPTKESGLSVK